jgi:hypothetical protein
MKDSSTKKYPSAYPSGITCCFYYTTEGLKDLKEKIALHERGGIHRILCGNRIYKKCVANLISILQPSFSIVSPVKSTSYG